MAANKNTKAKTKANAKSVVPVAPFAESVVFVPTSGNPYYKYSGNYAALDAGGHVVLDGNRAEGFPVEERYEINLEHRPQKRKGGKGMWQISYDQEFECFKLCRKQGAFEPWQTCKHLGYGVYVPDILVGDKTPRLLGVDQFNKQVKVCQFREGTVRQWHGFPIDYMDKNEDYICDNALQAWLRLGIIRKSEIDSIKNKEESVLS